MIAKFEAMNLATYTFMGYVAAVSQSIERRKGWHQKLTKYPRSRRRRTRPPSSHASDSSLEFAVKTHQISIQEIKYCSTAYLIN
jgi:hypothetical protein